METKLNKKIPNFNVSVTGNSKLDSKDLLGKKVVIYFYPKDNLSLIHISEPTRR